MHTFPLLNLFWTMLWFFLWILWIFLLVRVVGDLFRSRDLGGGAKAIWLIVIVVLPYIGVFIYVISRGGSLHLREVDRAEAGEKAFRDYISQAAGTGSPSLADELTKLTALKDQGILSADEYATAKQRLLTA